MSAPGRIEPFLEFSSRVTAFTVGELQRTGQVETYLETVAGVVGEDLLGDMLAIDVAIRSETRGDAAARDRLLRRWVFGDERFGPVARNIVKLWYLGTWYALPQVWHEVFGSGKADSTFIVSAAVYSEGLSWPRPGSHRPAAKGPGRGAWGTLPGPLPV
jgi:hypothetical protein